MTTRVLLKTKQSDLAFGYYDTKTDTIYNDAEGSNKADVVGLYIIKNNGLTCTEDKQEIKDHLQTFRIIQDN
jgi:hypothetical protein